MLFRSLRMLLERNRTIILIFSRSRPFPSYFVFKRSHNGIFEFFCYFFGIFYYGCGWNGKEQKFLFSLVLDLFHPILSSKEAIIVFFNFLNIFAIFLNFVLRMGLERNGTIIFIFSRSHSFPTYFGFKRSHNGIL